MGRIFIQNFFSTLFLNFLFGPGQISVIKMSGKISNKIYFNMGKTFHSYMSKRPCSAYMYKDEAFF